MKKKYINRICILAAFVAVAAAGIGIVHWQTQTVAPKVVLSSKPLIPDYRMSASQTKKVAAPVVMPLKKDGIPGKAGKDFLALQGLYNLALTPTYDGSNQATHPKLLYFPTGWNGYKYWMSITPYPATDDDYENPCIVTSNDMKTWVVPKGIKNPVTGIPADVKYGGHYSDSEIVMNGNSMELWYRYNYGNKKTGQVNNNIDYYYRITSTDGIHWSKPELMQSSKFSILSLAITRQNGLYHFWYTNCAHHLMSAVSVDGKHWMDYKECKIPLPDGDTPWHQDVVYFNNRYYLLQTAINHKKYFFSVFLSESSDGVHFTTGVPFFPSDNSVILHKTWLYRSTFAPVENGKFQMVISYRLPSNKWFMTQCVLPMVDWNNACLTGKALILKAPKVRLPSSSGSGRAIYNPGKRQTVKQPPYRAPVKPKQPSASVRNNGVVKKVNAM